VERRVKERLVGAAVLMATAIILIPEMLSGPRRDARTPIAQPSTDTQLKTYTIDLNRSPGAPAASQIDERVPPPEVAASNPPSQSDIGDASQRDPSENSTPAPQAIPERNETSPAQQSQPPTRVAAEAPPRTAERTLSQPQPREPNPERPIASAPIAPTSRGWAVQLGSFASRATADRMVKDLSQQGQNAFVMPVKSGSSTLYRVRIGPFAERGAANDALREVKGRVANAAVVAHP
jgi:DedD protein